MKEQVLCIEDDLGIQILVRESLRDFDVFFASSISDASNITNEKVFDLVLIDIQLPDGDGLRFLIELVKKNSYEDVPILILSGMTNISNKVMAFNCGADDFICKPFDPIELHARVHAKMKRKKKGVEDSRLRKLGNLWMDFDRQKVFFREGVTEIDLGLTHLELKILSILTSRMEQVFSRSQILDFAWGGETHVSERTVDSHIAHVRNKIIRTQVEIETVKSLGYRSVFKRTVKPPQLS